MKRIASKREREGSGDEGRRGRRVGEGKGEGNGWEGGEGWGGSGGEGRGRAGEVQRCCVGGV